jgi:hypothetical protein
LISAGGNEQATEKKRRTSGDNLREKMVGQKLKDRGGMAIL